MLKYLVEYICITLVLFDLNIVKLLILWYLVVGCKTLVGKNKGMR